MPRKSLVSCGLAALGLWLAAGAHAQSFCSSDGQPAPLRLTERFISADCAGCWSDPTTPPVDAGTLAIDWIVPSAGDNGSGGDEAPLAAAATRDALERLAALGRPAPPTAGSVRMPVVAPRGGRLRVAHGLPVNDYMGTSIEWRTAAPPAGALTAWLVLVETLPAGTEGSPVERNLVRNVLLRRWDLREQLSKSEQRRGFESRPMRVPEGAAPDRLRVVGWIEDSADRTVAAAQSRCAPQQVQPRR